MTFCLLSLEGDYRYMRFMMSADLQVKNKYQPDHFHVEPLVLKQDDSDWWSLLFAVIFVDETQRTHLQLCHAFEELD